MRVSPSTALAATALFFALGGSAIAVNEAVKPQARCQPGAVRGYAAVNGDPAKGMANFPDQFTSAKPLIGARFNCAGGGAAGTARQRRRVRGPLPRERDGQVATASSGTAETTIGYVGNGVFRVSLWVPGAPGRGRHPVQRRRGLTSARRRARVASGAYLGPCVAPLADPPTAPSGADRLSSRSSTRGALEERDRAPLPARRACSSRPRRRGRGAGAPTAADAPSGVARPRRRARAPRPRRGPGSRRRTRRRPIRGGARRARPGSSDSWMRRGDPADERRRRSGGRGRC